MFTALHFKETLKMLKSYSRYQLWLASLKPHAAVYELVWSNVALTVDGCYVDTFIDVDDFDFTDISGLFVIQNVVWKTLFRVITIPAYNLYNNTSISFTRCWFIAW